MDAFFCIGYFAFPPSGVAPHAQDDHGVEFVTNGDPRPHGHDVDEAETSPPRGHPHRSNDPGRRARTHTPHSDKAQRLRQERGQVSEGEIEYVRMGLSIRDEFGRVDKARTDLIRAEIRKRDEVANIIRQWGTYETRWQTLLASDRPVAFADIPWPVPTPPSSVDDLRPEAIVQFFVDSLFVPGSTATAQGRLRSALLRWHPDKMSAVFSRTVESEVDSVREGVNIVFRALHAHTRARAPRDDATDPQQ
ncbi:hypothetical protein BN946_scf184965.g2 [Trametes cinnabarina]|uniref:J domain-containing protein n=1 Tax=Pycnoporus cinnabarinus TaxID=5643 RepID=A0A060SKS6_PYCCI|nr:hypothetical protein BN946_scf184965.g2 [Trametes cinnabarina]